MFTLIPMKKNKTFKLLSIFFLVFSLIACSPISKDTDVPVEPSPGIVEPEEQKLKMTFSLLGKDYLLPTSYQDLKADGWLLEDDSSFVLEPGQFIKNRFVRNGPYILEFSFYNPGDAPQTLEDSLVSSLASENRTFGQDKASDIKIHDLINFDTDIDTIIEELGDYDLVESAQFKTYTFKHDALSKSEIKIEQDTGLIRWIIIENFRLN